jgi:hypothetical protein
MPNDLTLAAPAVQDTGRREAVAPVLIALAGLSGGQACIFSVCCFIMLYHALRLLDMVKICLERS